MIFIKNGKSSFKITYVSKNGAAHFAAKELQKYLSKATSCLLDMAGSDSKIKEKSFYIGLFKNAELAKQIEQMDMNGDGYVLDIEEDNIFLTAKTNRGLIFGVYRFLEDFLGVRFFDVDSEKIPTCDSLELPIKRIVDKPSFAFRSYLDGKLLDGQGMDYDIHHLKFKMCNEHRHLSDDLGGECAIYGRNGTHNMCEFVPKEKYMSTHPEFYAVCERFTTIDLLNGITDDGRLDESMEISVLKIVIEEMKKDIVAHPDMSYFQFEQEDSDTYARYEEGSGEDKILKKYGRSGILIRFCNVLASELQKWADKELNGRKIYIVTFAYSYSKEPPVVKRNGNYYPIDETVVAAPNLIIRMAFFYNAAYSYFDSRQEGIKELLDGWSVVAKRFFFWAYDTDYVSYLWYFPSFHVIRKNILGFKKIGVEYLMVESSIHAPVDWQASAKSYIYSRLMWNHELSVNELFNEYMDYYYGLAASFIKRIVAIMENYSSFVDSVYDNYYVDTFKWTYRHVDLENEALFNRILLILDEAEKAVVLSGMEDKEIYLKRLAAVRVTFLHMKINKVNDQLYKNINKSGVSRFSEDEDIPENRKQGFYDVEMVHRVVKPVIIPEEVKEKINSLDVYSIMDTIDLDAE